MLGVHVGLQPVLITEHSGTFELLVVEVKTNKRRVRILTGYGPQETWNLEEKMLFFNAVEEEIAKAVSESISVILMGDLNSKLGKDYIQHDPKEQSENGAILAGIIDRHALCVVNGLGPKVKGTITRQRTTVNNIEKSVIDFVIVSQEMVDMVESMVIDEKRNHTLTKTVKTKTGIKKTESDHNTIVTKIKMMWDKKINKTREIFHFKDDAGQKKFKEKTDNTNELSQILSADKDVDILTNKFLKRLNGFIHECFKKIKVKEKVDSEMEALYAKRSELRNKEDNESKQKLKVVEKELDDKYAEDMQNKIQHELKGINSEEGGWNSGQLWKLKKKLSPRPSEPPTAMESDNGVLLTAPDQIANEAVKHYTKLLENKPMAEKHKDIQTVKENLCEIRLKTAANNKTEPWTTEDVKCVLRYLKRNKSRDPQGFANEVFKPDVAGNDLVLAITILMNKIKEQQKIPEKMKLCNITSLYKNKGPRNKFDSYRGIFRVTVLRNILDRLIYEDTYETIDSNLSDCNVGSRRGRNIRDNLFVLNAVINNARGKSEEALDIGVYDVRKCFDTMWNQEAINDIYELGFQNDKLPLLYLENETAKVAIKTSAGTTERVTIRNNIMQGTVWAGLMCTATMDKLGKQVYKTPHLLYKYKGTVDVPPLEMVDDILTLSKCGATSLAMNATVNAFITSKKLELNKNKCSQIHIGKKSNLCPKLKVHNGEMKKADQEKYLGDVINKNGKQNATIVERISKGHGIVTNILALIKDIPLGNRRVEIGLDLRQAWFINGILFNSEVWQKLNQKDINDICKLDYHLLRSILGAHSKVPIEMLYLETASLPIPQIITTRRLMYHQEILKRPPSELVKRVFQAMKDDPTPGDWCELVSNDFESINMHIDDKLITQMSKSDYKELISEKVRSSTLELLQKMQQNHQKVKHIEYTHVKRPQEYIICNKFSKEESSLLFNLRCRTVKDIKKNFHAQFGGDSKCELCQVCEDSQEHVMECPELEKRMVWDHTVQYEYIFGSTEQQKLVITLYSSLLELRDRLQAERRPTGAG